MDTSGQPDVRASAKEFLTAAFSILLDEKVLPVPTYRRHIRVGYDYFGPDLMFRPEFKQFESILQTNYPRRFEKPLDDRSVQFPNSYVFSLLEACVARLTQTGEPFDADSAAVNTCIEELLEVLAANDHEVACCRVVSHLTTIDGQVAEIAGVSVVPIAGKREMYEQLAAVMPDVSRAFGRDAPFVFEPPQSILVVRDRGVEPYKVGERLSMSIDRFMLLVRLLTGGTTESLFQVQGETQLVHAMSPLLTEYRQTMWPLIRRTTWLRATDPVTILALGELLDGLGVERTDVVVTSFVAALRKFNSVQLGQPWYEQIVDLVTALEATLSGQDKDDVVLRVRSRAAALLATPDDPAANIFKDVGKLYALRSTLIHGGTLRIKDARKVFRGLSTAGSGHPEGVEVALGVDRLRDIVRRGILARMALAQDEAVWPLRGDTPIVDEVLADDSERNRWRSTWRTRLASLGAETAIERAIPASDALGQDSPPNEDESGAPSNARPN